MSSSYGYSQEEAERLGLPRCPECGLFTDARSEHQFFMYDAVLIRCTPCRLYTVVGDDGPWIQMPPLDASEYGKKAAAAWQELEDIARRLQRERST